MPTAPPKPCLHPGCGALVRDGSGRCPVHQAQRQQQVKEQAARYDKARGTSSSRGYGAKWQRARAAYLLAHPLCVRCQAEGRVEPATVLDHIKPHKGDQALFWDSGNWQALCKPCHDSKTASEDGGWGHPGRGG